MDPYIGEIRLFAGTYVPVGWNLCDGSLLNISTYQALYSKLGNVYGGDNINTFGLPDLRLKVPVGTGTITAAGGSGNYVLAAAGGATKVTLSPSTMPSHTHALQAVNTPATTGNSTNAMLAQTNGSGGTLTPPYPDVTLYTTLPLTGGTAVTNGVLANSSCQLNGSGTSHDNQMPYISIYYIIALIGIYPMPQ